MRQFKYMAIFVFLIIFLGGCISATNETVQGGTADVTECTPLEGVLDGADFVPKSAISNHEDDGRTHPDTFFIAWGQLDTRTDLRFPARGFDDTGYEDKLMVSRKEADGTYKTWQIYPPLDNECQDVEKVRIHSFDVAPDGQSLYVAMSKPIYADNDTLKANDLNPDRNLGIFKMDISTKKLTPLTHDYSLGYMYPTYIGDDNNTGHEMLLIAKTVTKDDIPMNYKYSDAELLDEYERSAVTLIHKLDSVTGAINLIGFNNSHQVEPMVLNRDDNISLVVFTQWEHQATINRFSLWKMQIDGSDNFMYYGDEANTYDTSENVYQAREVRSGPYKGYILMGESARVGNEAQFLAEGHILMTQRDNLDLRSDKIFLAEFDNDNGVERYISRTPEHYNDESFVYAYREDVDSSYSLYVKDYPTDLNASVDEDPGSLIISSDSYHFMQPRSFYPPVSRVVAPGLSELSENRVSFTNSNLNGKSGFLVNTLGQSDNGEQHQLDGIDTNNIRMQFFVPSQTFSDSQTIGTDKSPEMSIPSSGFIPPESDGSMGIILKDGLYVWKINKKFPLTDALNESSDIWIPVRVERQEVSFVSNRVNACNQCHQERSQENIDKYEDYHSIAERKMEGNLSDVFGTDKDISDFNATYEIPDFHKDIAPLFTKVGLNGGKSCADCHNSHDKLNLSNMTGVSSMNSTYRSVALGAHKMPDSEEKLPYLYESINPMGMDEVYHPAPFLWSLLLNDDLSVPEDENHSNSSSRNLERDGDYGAVYSEEVEAEIARVNGIYDHSKHWSASDVQKMITYGSTRIPVGLSDRITFKANNLDTSTAQAQKAYQSMVRNCYDCHSDHTIGGINDSDFEDAMPKEKRYTDPVYLKNRNMRFVIRRHKYLKEDTKFSQYTSYSYLYRSKSETLSSALYRVDFNDLNNSELLVYARGYYIESNGTQTPLNDTVKDHSYLSEGEADYIAIENWLNGVAMTNQPGVVNEMANPLVIKEYADPAYLEENITWSDPDENELSQLIMGVNTGFNDSMLSLEYNSFTSANVKAYAILGDRGDQNFTFTVTDGIDSSNSQQVPVKVTSDYIVPRPSSSLPEAYLFFTDRNTSELKKLDTNGTEITVGTIEGFSQHWTTMYRRADKGWLYFLNQDEQKIYVVSETNASILFDITLDHEPMRETDIHKQTVYLLWWRPAEGNITDPDYKPGELHGMLKSKLSKTLNGDYYVNFGSAESSSVVEPKWVKEMPDGGNTIGVYVWRRATFMTKWVNEGIDRINVLNLVTGNDRALSDFSFDEKTVDEVDYDARDYSNVRALVIAEDGAFYGFNKDLNSEVETFNFDPIEKIQTQVDIPFWLQTYINNYQSYSTPFLVIEPRDTE